MMIFLDVSMISAVQDTAFDKITKKKKKKKKKKGTYSFRPEVDQLNTLAQGYLGCIQGYHDEDTPIQIYRKLHLQKLKIFG